MRVTVHTPTPDLAASLDFYDKLGFRAGVNENADAEQSVILTCGAIEVEINPDRFARAGLRLTKSSWDTEVAQLQEMTTVVPLEDGHLVVDPSGVWVYLTEGDEGAASDPEAADKQCLLGNFAGVSLETASLQASVDFWGVLGFATELGDEGVGDQGWVAGQSDSEFMICWMKPNSCPHLFYNPSLTFFNSGKNPEIIKEIRTAGIEITEEITVFSDTGDVDNVIVRDPGGYGFFVFND